ncbi:cytochrome-c oxidase, cbb3-type subunit III [Biformimicrobium ophioploci]|uniref:Cbb3-type cytochrome c oxidase subunit n=1 Tax=Biformimicrobium ophioploci TaxID=3036711 RepID=A0ABQ6LXI2_9GAMM|nr:cytochrome-c oxidase, cbb3-type subunit III [Microbulbifer sp. NKW57]GMG86803.1 cytochrome-c oxidase, cbb3-type subunit III [Microbulbifer sp. NKW57]
MSSFWSWWIIGLTVTNLVLVTWVLFANRKVAVDDQADPENKTTGHVYDGIEEYDNPLPKWWFLLFVGTLIYGILYLVVYPGMGNWKGVGGWTSVGALEKEQEEARSKFEASFGELTKLPVEKIAEDPQALKMGGRIFANNCSVCHGADGGGNFGFPNLTDGDWLYGGSGEKILETLYNGRQGMMPPQGPVIGEKGVKNVTEYVLSLNGLEHDAALAAEGKKVFNTVCMACHGMDAKGNQMLGAPNLTDNIWLYGDTREGIAHSIRNGRSNLMPAQKELLRDDKIRLVAAYVLSLSQQETESMEQAPEKPEPEATTGDASAN